MALYRVTAPNGKDYEIEGPAGASNALVVQALLAQYPDAARKPPETTILGQVKEGFKGLVPGAVGLVESAATGASALLPEDYEKVAREKIASIAGAAKAPFAAAPGYEETVGRKLGEAVGSTVPFLAAGPLGLAGRIGAVGLGVGAGAGEARTRAEKEGATAEQRGTATALGIIPGAMEVFAPFRILSRVPDAATAQGVQLVKRALVAGGEEAAQEAASGFAQNLIAKGIYKPEQELIEGLGEQAAYGGATGAIVQGLMDLALGRRARGAQPAPGTLPGEAPIERAERLAAEKAAAPPPAPATPLEVPVGKTTASEVTKEDLLDLGRKTGLISEEAPTPPIAETPAPPPIEEPKVRKPGEPPAGGLQPAEIEELGISKKQPIYRRMLGKDLEQPEQRAEVLADIENYLTRGNGSEESRTKLAEFKAKFASAEAVTPAAPSPAVEAATTTAQPSVRELALEEQRAAGWNTEWPFIPADLTNPDFRQLINDDPSIPLEEKQQIFESGKKLGVIPVAETVTIPTETPSVPSVPTEPEAGRTGAPVVSEPGAGAAPEGVGVEPTGVVPPVADVGKPVGGEGAAPAAVTPAEPEAAEPAAAEAAEPAAAEPAKPAPTEIARGEYEPPVKAGLKPEREQQLREKLAQQRKELAVLETARDKAEGNIYLAEITGNEEAKAQAIDAHEAARLVLKKATAAADRTYAQIFDMEQADFEGSVGEAYVAELRAEQQAKAQAARAPELAGSYPYNLKTAEAVQEELRDQASHLPGYKELIEKYFTPSRQLRKGRTEEEFVREGQKFLSSNVLYQQARTGPVDLENSREMDTALRGKSFTESIDYAIKNSRDDLDRQIMVKAKRRAEELAAKGVEFSFELIEEGKVFTGRTLGLTTTTSSGLGEATKVKVKLNGFTGDASDTLSQETLAHEIVHAVTVAQITYAPQGTAAIKLRALQQELVNIHNQRYKAKTLTATERGVVLSALQNEKELLAYGLTNGDVQNWLASIPSPTGGTFLSRMFSIVSQVLGLKGKETSALAQLMSISEEIFDESLAPYVAEANRRGLSFGKQPNVTGFPSWVLKEAQGLKTVWHKGPVALYEAVSTVGKPIYIAAKENVGRTKVDIRSYTGTGFTPAELAELRQAADSLTPQASPRLSAEATAAAAEADAIGERKRTTLTEKVGRELQGNTALRLREKFTDSLAPLEDFFVNAYGGQIRTAGGRLNPMVLLSRALDALRVSKAVQEQGGLGREDGLIVATELKNDKGEPISYQGVLKRIADAAKAEGKTYEEYQKTIDNVLYGHREFNLRERNKTLDADEQVDLLLDDKQIDALEAAFQKDDFIKGVSTDLDAIRFNLLDTLVETGRISKEQAQDYKDAIGYIPFERIGDYENAWTGATRGANRGVAALKKMRKLEGSNRKSTSVVENFSGLVDWATKEAMKNEAASRALEDMVLLGAAKRGPKPATDSPGGEVQVFKDGKLATFYVPDPAHLVAFSLADPQLSKILKAFQRGAQVLRAGVTSMPPFAIKQVFDDVVRAYTYAGVKNNAALVRNVLFNFPKNWMNEILKRKPEGIRELEALGIVGTFDFSQQGGNLQNILEGAGAKKEGLGSSILRVMEAGAKASDVAVREAIYKQVLKETGDKAQAESAAREIINFSRRGSSKMMGQMISIIPFFNAYARGMDKLATAAAGKVVGQTTGTARSMFYSRMAVLTAMGLAYALMMQDDEEYNKLPDHVRDTNWILPYGKELGFTPAIPIPADLAFFFKAIPERLVRYYKYQGTDEERTAMEVLGELTKRGIDVFSSPNVTPQILRPFIENIVNYSFFLGRPLESQAQLKLRPFERYGTGTSDTMKAVAEILEDAANATGIEAFAVSPIKLENAVRGLLGSAAGLSLSVADMVVNPSRTDRPLHQQLVPQLTGAAAVMKNPVGTRYMDEIYSLENRTEQVYGTYNRLKQNDPDKAEKFLDDNIGMYEIRGAVQSVMKQIRNLNKMAMDIDKDTSMSPEERRKEIDELRVEQNEIARVVFSLRKEARDIQMGL